VTVDKYGIPWVYWGEALGCEKYISYYAGKWYSIQTPPLPKEGDLEAHPDGALWISSYGVLPNDTAYIYAVRYDTTGFSDLMIIQHIHTDTSIYYFSPPQFAVDSAGKVWAVWGVKDTLFFRPDYSVWDGQNWCQPMLIDTLEGIYPSVIYDCQRDRIWVVWKSTREGYSAVYVSYTQASRLEERTGLTNIFLESSPNPFRRVTQIRYGIAVQSFISVKIYNLSGELVYTIAEREKTIPGTYSIYWDMRNNKGEEVKNGIYFLRFETENITKTQKILLLK
jgi:hypothetical protein